MKLTKEIIQAAADNASMSIRAYSGRRMNGKQCVAVTSDSLGSLVPLGVALAYEAACRADDTDAANVLDAVDDMLGDVSAPSIDSLGLGYVAYWPSIAWTEEG